MKSNLRSLVLLAALAAAAFLTRTALANTALWIGNPGVSATTNWSDNVNWNNLGTGGAGFSQNDVLFGNAGAVSADNTIDSVANVSDTAFSLTFTNQSSQFHTVLIPTGITLTNANGLTVGSSPLIDANNTKVNFTGDGTLVQLGNVTVRNNASTSGSTSLATLDLSGLASFVCSNAGTLNVGGTGSETRSGGALVLAGVSNNITVTTLNLQTTSGNGGNSGGANLRLGLGANLINAGTINIVSGKAVNGTLSFQGATGELRIRGAAGNADDSSRANITIANRNTGGTGTLTGTADFTGGHVVDIKAGTITIGQAGTNPTSATQNGTANLRFDAGTVDATNINLAINTVANAATTANFAVGGTLVVSNLSLVNQTAGAATGNLFIGGTVNCSGNIAKTTLAGTGNLTITNGTLTLTAGRTAGTADQPIDNVNLTTASLNLPLANSLAVISAVNLNLADDANILNIPALPSIPGFPVQYPIITYAASIGAGSLALGTLPAGYSGYISNDMVTTVWLVVTNGPFVAKTDTWSGAANNVWDTTSSNWTSAGVAVTYNDGDVVLFDDSARTNNVNLTTTSLPSVLTVSNNTLNYTFSGVGSLGGAVTLVKQGSAALTLAETGGDSFVGGIQANNGTVILDNANSAIAGGLTVTSGATAQIGNNSGNGNLPSGAVVVDGTLVFSQTNDVTVTTVIAGAGSLVKNASGRLTLSGASSYAGLTTVNNGTLALAGAGSISNSPQVTVNGAALDLSAKTGLVALNALSLANASLALAMPNLQTPLNVTSLSLSGAGNTINVTSLPPIATYPVSLTLVQSASPISGFNLSVGILPAATPAYAGTVALSADQTAVVLTLNSGPVGIRPAVFWTDADLAKANTNWSDGANWFLPGAPGTADNVVFTTNATAPFSALFSPGGGASVLDPANFNNIVDTDFTIASLTYTNLAATYHNTHLANGRTLNITNALTVGAVDSGTTAQQEFVTVSGAAAVNVNNTNGNFQVWVGSSSAGGSQATLDLSALDSFNAAVGRLTVGACAVNNAVNRPSGILYLARTNTISAGFQTTTMHSGTATGNAGLVVADCNQNAGSASSLYLGLVNTLSADTIAIGRQKAAGHLLFNPIYANIPPYPTVTLQGFTSSRVADFTIGDGTANTGTTGFSADADLSGGMVNAAVDVLNLGRASTGGTAGMTTGTLTFDAGTINANTVNIGLQPVSSTKAGSGTINVNANAVMGVAAKLVVNGSLTLGSAVGGGGEVTTSGTLTINGGTVLASNIVAGVGSTSTINLNGGTLAVSNTAGTPIAPLTTLSFTAGVLQLSVDGNAGAASLVATTIIPSGTTVLNIGAIANVTATATLPLISYTGTDPFSSFSLGTYPAGYKVALVDDTANSMIELSIIPPPPSPRISSISFGGGGFIISGTNGTAGNSYYVLSSTNVALARTNWTRIYTGQFGVGGSFLFTNALDASVPRRFYLIQTALP